MKSILCYLCLLLFNFGLCGQEQSAVEQDAGLMVSVIRGTNGVVPLTRKQWEAVNQARLAHKWEAYSYDEARTNASINTPYVIMALVMLETEITSEFRKATGRQPFSQEVLACWLVGKDKFKRLKYDWSKVPEGLEKRLLQKFDDEKRISNIIKSRPAPPPPLPANETRHELLEQPQKPNPARIP